MSLHYLSLVPLRQASSVNLPAFVTRSLTQHNENQILFLYALELTSCVATECVVWGDTAVVV